jgi:hypothetical protein
MHQPLPQDWVDRLFARISVRYGAAWTRMWEGIDMQAVKSDWAYELGGMQDHPDAVRFGLQHMNPDKPPTASQFRALCNRMPDKAHHALPPPKADPTVIAKVREILASTATRSPTAWAAALRDRERSGEVLTKPQRDAWRAVITEQHGSVFDLPDNGYEVPRDR